MPRTHVESHAPVRLARRSLSACLLASALALVVAAGLVRVAPAAWTAFQQINHGRPTLAECAAISNGPARLACYDTVEKAASPPPAKGANALLPSH